MILPPPRLKKKKKSLPLAHRCLSCLPPQLHLISVLESGLPNDVVGESAADTSPDCKPDPAALLRTQDLLKRCKGEAQGAGIANVKMTTLVSCVGGSADMVSAPAWPGLGEARRGGAPLCACGSKQTSGAAAALHAGRVLRACCACRWFIPARRGATSPSLRRGRMQTCWCWGRAAWAACGGSWAA